MTIEQEQFLQEYNSFGININQIVASVFIQSTSGLEGATSNPVSDGVNMQLFNGGQIGGDLSSPNFKTGSSGWQIKQNGNVEFNAGTFRGALQANSIDIPDTTSSNSFHVDNMGNTWWGSNSFATAPASIANTGAATFSNVTVNGSQITNQDVYGDGNDGAAVISGDTTLTGDKYYTDLTINNGVTLNPGGYRIFVNGTLTRVGTGIIARNGNAGGAATAGSGTRNGGTPGSAGAAAAALAAGSLPGGLSGIAGVNGTNSGAGGNAGAAGTAGNAGGTVAAGLGATSRTGATGGNGGGSSTGNSGGSGGSAGAAGSFTAAKYSPRSFPLMVHATQIVAGTSTSFNSNGNDGGGQGGAEGGNTIAIPVYGGVGGGSGGNGSDGGFIFVAARILALANSNTFIQSKGGAGGAGGAGSNGSSNGANGGGGGGGGAGGHGGSGGVTWLVYSKLSTGTIVFDVSGGSLGAGGAGGTAGTNGVNGSTGTSGSTGQSGVSVSLKV